MRDAFRFPRVQVVPGVEDAVFTVDGVPRVTYCFGLGLPRPFFFPVLGPSGAMLTRMGHPNPVGHEHHKSVWFGHQKVGAVNFWEEKPNTDVAVRHRRVVLYHDASDWGGFVAEIDWWANGRVQMRQRLIAVLEPLEGGNCAFDLQSEFSEAGAPVELGQTNFGFLGVRVAKTISEQFGGGTLRNDRGGTGESELFAKPARWVDYSGPMRPGVDEGITLLDHPTNPGHPVSWHVRRDGWMEPAFNLRERSGIAKDHPLALRYRLFIHAGRPTVESLNQVWESFAKLPPYEVEPGRGGSLARLMRQQAR